MDPLIGAALLGHLLMDTANGYGTHLFYPFSARWIYGDAVFVLEPWLWVILGATLALNASRFWRDWWRFWRSGHSWRSSLWACSGWVC